jgi:hypothetical protein
MLEKEKKNRNRCAVAVAAAAVSGREGMRRYLHCLVKFQLFHFFWDLRKEL